MLGVILSDFDRPVMTFSRNHSTLYFLPLLWIPKQYAEQLRIV